MPSLSNYRLFISHSWAHSDAYEKLVEMLDAQPNFQWSNYSVPMDDPIHDADNATQLYAAIKRQVAPVNCVLILAGVYGSYSKWINNEIEISTEDYTKPIIAIEPWAAEKTSKVVKDAAAAVVKWQGASVVKAIREHAI